MYEKIHNRGMTALEVVIGVSIAGVIITYSIFAVGMFMNSARDVADRTQALYLAEEGFELARYMRDNNWNNIASLTENSTYYLHASGTVLATTTPEVIGMFTRSFEVERVTRDVGNDDIVPEGTSGSVTDAESRYIRMTVTWGTTPSSVTLETILANLDP